MPWLGIRNFLITFWSKRSYWNLGNYITDVLTPKQKGRLRLFGIMGAKSYIRFRRKYFHLFEYTDL